MAQLLPDCRLNYFWIGGSPNTGLPAQRMAEYSSRLDKAWYHRVIADWTDQLISTPFQCFVHNITASWQSFASTENRPRVFVSCHPCLARTTTKEFIDGEGNRKQQWFYIRCCSSFRQKFFLNSCLDSKNSASELENWPISILLLMWSKVHTRSAT